MSDTVDLSGPATHLEQLVIGDDDHAVHRAAQCLNACNGLRAAPPALKGEGVAAYVTRQKVTRQKVRRYIGMCDPSCCWLRW
jgi:hypothetical protein